MIIPKSTTINKLSKKLPLTTNFNRIFPGLVDILEKVTYYVHIYK